MANEKIMNTRIQLKYDSFANWSNSTVVLKAGEIAIAYLGETVSEQIKGENRPVLFKVGDGVKTFANLPWASALAADVYDWAKKETPDWDDFDTIPVAKLPEEALIDDNDTAYEFAIVDGKLQVIETPHVNGVAGTPVITTYDFVTPAELASALENYYTKDEVDGLIEGVEAKIPTSLGVMSVSGKEAIKTSGDSDVEVSLALDNSGNVVLSQSDTGLKATIDLSAYRLIEDDKDTQFGLAYDSDNKQIKIIPNGGESYIDASDFIADGMLESVVADQINNTLTFTWNTDGNKTVTTVELSAIADIYTGVDGTTVKVDVSSDNKISAEVKTGTLKDGHIASDAAIAETKLAQGVQDALALARTALQSVEHPDYTDEFAGKKDKQTSYVAEGSTVKTITKVEQNENGEVAITYSDIAFPAPPVVNDGKFTVSGTGALTGSGEMTANQADDTTATLDIAEKGVTTAKIADQAVGAEQTKAFRKADKTSEEVWVFYCGTASELV